jgi:hypothetical protein
LFSWILYSQDDFSPFLAQGQYPFFLRTCVLLIERFYNCCANLMVLLNFVSFLSQGLRGAMAFALALQSVTDLPNNHGRVLLTATLFTIIFTVKPPPTMCFHSWSISHKLMVAHTCQTNSCRLLKRLVERHYFFYWWKYKMDTTYVKYPQENFDHVWEHCIYTHIWIN